MKYVKDLLQIIKYSILIFLVFYCTSPPKPKNEWKCLCKFNGSTDTSYFIEVMYYKYSENDAKKRCQLREGSDRTCKIEEIK